MHSPRPRRFPSILLWFAVAALSGSVAMGAMRPDLRALPPPPADAEGLQRTPSSKVDEFYLRPGASFTAYHRVRLTPVDVAYEKDWLYRHKDVDEQQSEQLRQRLEQEARRVFSRQMQRRGGYQVVDEAGPDVLEVRVSIVNLDIYAPEIDDSLIRRNYVQIAGEATLLAELRDSQSGLLLGRVVDRRETREYLDYQLANRVSNSADALELVGLWSNMLRRYLDTTRTDSKGS